VVEKEVAEMVAAREAVATEAAAKVVVERAEVRAAEG